MTTGHCASGASHAHHHHPPADAGGAKRLSVALAIIVAFAVLEVAGGWLSGSLALLADAGHMATDAAALALALSAQWIAQRPASDRYPFGLKRAQVLAAFVNGLALLLIVGVLVIEAFGRFTDPRSINAGLMLSVASLGLIANIAAFVILHPDAGRNVNVRGAMLHVAADIFGSVAAILSALVIMATGWMAIDAVLTLAVCVLIVRSAMPLVRETADVLLQAAPPDFDTAKVRDAVVEQSGVLDVDRIKAWQLTPGENLVALHVVIGEDADQDAALRGINHVLHEQFGIAQATVQIETAGLTDPHRHWAGRSDVHEAAE
ncbi:MAG: cation diffusion facilitator family transporter [Pseudomonadota bacterium]